MAKRASVKKTAAKRGGAKRKAVKRGTRAKAAKRTPASKKAARPSAKKKRATATKTRAKRPTARRAAKATRRPAAKTAKRKTAARAAASRSARRGKPAAKPSMLASAATAVRGAVAGGVAAVSQRLPWTSNEPDALTLLETDHRRLEELLKQGEDTTERAVTRRTELLNSITSELNTHEMLEERLLYPALQQHPEARAIVMEGYQEHHVVDLIVNELHGLARDNEQWGAKFKVLRENIEHHIQEEEGEMFRTARAVMRREDLLALGARMAALRASRSKGS